ncbi:MAG TPA: hypothetical protein VGR10_08020 [Thermoleophilaceae bacterium]|nr:hypothetical protein [Thermoleophilaceae bacterium]
MAIGALTPLGAAARGAVSGAAGTAAMTAVQTAYYKATGTESSSTPAEVGKRIVEGVLQREVPEERMDALNQGMHWLYGSSWGLPYGLVAGSRYRPGSVALSGAALGLSVWAASRAEMTAMQIAPPPWDDPPSTLGMDVGFHLVYGLAAALTFRALR